MSIIKKNNTYATITNQLGSIWVALICVSISLVFGIISFLDPQIHTIFLALTGLVVLALSLYLNTNTDNGRTRLERDYNLVRTALIKKEKKVDTNSQEHLIDLGDILQRQGKEEYFLGFRLLVDDYNSKIGLDEQDKPTYPHLDEHDLEYVNFTRSLPTNCKWSLRVVRDDLDNIEQFTKLGLEVDQTYFKEYKYYLIGKFDNLQKYESIRATTIEYLKEFKISFEILNIHDLITAITA